MVADNPLAAWLQGHGAEAGSAVPSGSTERTAPSDGVGLVNPVDSVGALDPWASTGLPEGLDADEPSRHTRRRGLLLAAAIPWLAVALLSVLHARGGVAPAPVVAAPAPPAPAPAPVASATPAQVAADPFDRAAALGIATLAVRTAASAAARDDGGAATYVDEAVATAAERVGNDLVVTVAAVVLHGGADGWQRLEQATYGVAVAGKDPPHVVAGPWPVGAARAAGTPPAVEAPEMVDAVRAALEREQWTVAALDVRRDQERPGVLVAHVTGTHPLQRAAEQHTVWLRDQSPPSLWGATAPPAEAPSALLPSHQPAAQ